MEYRRHTLMYAMKGPGSAGLFPLQTIRNTGIGKSAGAVFALTGEPLTFRGRNIALIAFYKGRPHTLLTQRKHASDRHDFTFYNLTWCRAERAWCYQESGGTSRPHEDLPRHVFGRRYFAIPVIPEIFGGIRLGRLPAKWYPNLFITEAWESETLWCTECNSYVAVCEGHYPCPHIFRCPRCRGNWSMPDYRCNHADPRQAYPRQPGS